MSDLTVFKPTIKPAPQKIAGDSVIELAVKFIRKKYIIKYNIFLNNFSIKEKSKRGAELSKTDLRLILKSNNIRIPQPDLTSILNSQIPNFKVSTNHNPVHDYLEDLKYDGNSHIEKLSEFINPVNHDNNKTDFHKIRFRKYFKKWFVAMVATALGLSKNDVMFIIVQKEGGTGKTGFIEYLSSAPGLIDYCKSITKNNYKTDILKETTRNILLIFDELAALNPRYINTFKSEISQAKIKTKFSYNPDEIILPRLGSFAGTTNFNKEKGGFIQINDKGLMRRLFCIENAGQINWQKYIKEIDINQLYAEAINLIKHTDYDYVFNPEDFSDFEKYNRRYLKNAKISEIISEYYEPSKSDAELVYLNATNIKAELISLNYPEHLITTDAIGKCFTALGFHQDNQRIGMNKDSIKVYHINRI